ncbi:unnamed protein product, partial [Pleuronectes platessa]
MVNVSAWLLSDMHTEACSSSMLLPLSALLPLPDLQGSPFSYTLLNDLCQSGHFFWTCPVKSRTQQLFNWARVLQECPHPPALPHTVFNPDQMSPPTVQTYGGQSRGVAGLSAGASADQGSRVRINCEQLSSVYDSNTKHIYVFSSRSSMLLLPFFNSTYTSSALPVLHRLGSNLLTILLLERPSSLRSRYLAWVPDELSPAHNIFGREVRSVPLRQWGSSQYKAIRLPARTHLSDPLSSVSPLPEREGPPKPGSDPRNSRK